MWDGKGIYDDATKTSHLCANYKLALLLYASRVLNLTILDYNVIESKLWSVQQANGSITSLADLDGNPIGSANTETTSIALLPYNEDLILTMQRTPQPTNTQSSTPQNNDKSGTSNSFAKPNSEPATNSSSMELITQPPTSSPTKIADCDNNQVPSLEFQIIAIIAIISVVSLSIGLLIRRNNQHKL